MGTKENQVICLRSREAGLKRKLRRHLQAIGFKKAPDGLLQVDGASKDVVRTLHAAQREERLRASRKFILDKAPKLLRYFASGDEVDPDLISPVLEKVASGTRQGDLFRFAALTWSVPVSNGFGRRMRYLVWDSHNGKLIGLIAIGDPVFNLAVRDSFIGWDVHGRAARLVNVMDAYVLGAVPPYNSLLGGKLIACLLRSRDLYEDFAQTYGAKAGIISGQEKKARLLAVTTSSSMGRSSVYNRLKLGGMQYLQPIGYTGGWGHFHIPDDLFCDFRDYLRAIGHKYADLHEFGQGPNWRLRTTRAALDALGFRDDMLRHGIQRQVFIGLLADNATEILRTGEETPDVDSLLTAAEVAQLAALRWIIPRSRRRPEYRHWDSNDLLDLFGSCSRAMPSHLVKVG